MRPPAFLSFGMLAATLGSQIFGLPLSAQPTAARASSSIASLSAFADSLERTGFSGTLLVGDRQDEWLARAMGVADARTGRRLTLDDRWRWASVSKQVTAAFVLREVDAGRMALDTPAVRYLPTFVGSGRDRISVRQLLQHSSGLPNPEAGDKDADGMPRVYRVRGTTVGDAAFARTCGGVLTATAGERFDYNNCDYLVLGALLSARTGRSSAALAGAALGADLQQPETVRGYVRADVPEPAFELDTYGSAGAMTGTARTLLEFDRRLLASLLSSAARAEMWRGDPRFGYAALGAWSFTAPLRGCTTPMAIVERRGEIQGVQVRNVLLPALGRAVIIFTNRGDVEFGEVWQGRGLLYELLSRAAC